MFVAVLQLAKNAGKIDYLITVLTQIQKAAKGVLQDVLNLVHILGVRNASLDIHSPVQVAFNAKALDASHVKETKTLAKNVARASIFQMVSVSHALKAA